MRDRDGLRARLRAELGQNGRHMMVNRLGGDKQALRDRGIAQAFGQQREYLRLVTGANEKYADWLTYV